MDLATLICPQCGAPLPRRALWRTVVCTYCSAEVTYGTDVVLSASFTQAYLRSRGHAATGSGTITCNGEHYKVLQSIGSGSNARVLLAQRLGALPERVVLKLAHPGTAPGRMKMEAEILHQLQQLQHAGAAYFSQRLPQLVGHGIADEDGQRGEALLLRCPTGYWGSLADLRHNYPQGVAACHVVWMWRRILEVIGFTHDAGWVHGNLAPEHLLVHPGDHGILIIGWAAARRHASRATLARDLMQAAWSIRSVLDGGEDEPPITAATPAPLAALLKRASEDGDWCAHMGAAGIDRELKAAARAIFGPPRFIPFTPYQR